jgi:hypothetical protein
LQSKLQGGKVLETPYLDIHYQYNGNWQQPPEPREP